MSTAKPKLANSIASWAAPNSDDSHPAPPPANSGHPSDGTADGRSSSRPDLTQPLADGTPAKPVVERNEGYKVQGTKSPRPTLEALLTLVKSYYSDLDVE